MIYFSQIKEDDRVERHITSEFKSKRILCIGSGGCTAFSVLHDTIENLFCVDYNPAQCHLIELKKAAISVLKRNDYLAFIGEAQQNDRVKIFNDIKSLLSITAKEYWEADLPAIEMGINKISQTEKFYRYIASNLLQYATDKETIKLLFSQKTLERQREIYSQYFKNNIAWQTGIKILLSNQSHQLFFPGFIFQNSEIEDFGSYFLINFEKEVNSKLLANNYFLSQFFFEEYIFEQNEGCPYYLTEEGYEVTQRNIHKLQIINTSLSNLYDKKIYKIDTFFISNVFDWSDEHTCKAIFKEIDCVKSKHAGILYRNMFSNINAQNIFNNKLSINETISNEILALERSLMYQKITWGILQ